MITHGGVLQVKGHPPWTGLVDPPVDRQAVAFEPVAVDFQGRESKLVTEDLPVCCRVQGFVRHYIHVLVS